VCVVELCKLDKQFKDEKEIEMRTLLIVAVVLISSSQSTANGYEYVTEDAVIVEGAH